MIDRIIEAFSKGEALTTAIDKLIMLATVAVAFMVLFLIAKLVIIIQNKWSKREK